MRPITRYRCDLCGRLYRTSEVARLCETQPDPDLGISVGDIVVCDGTSGWINKDVSWAQSVEGPKGWTEVKPLYVVGTMDVEQLNDPAGAETPLVEMNAHRLRFHLFTDAYEAGTGRQQGLAFNFRRYIAEKIPKIVSDAPPLDVSPFIGGRATRLL